MAVYQASFEDDLLKEIASYLKEISAPHPLSLAEVQVFLPTHRACRRLSSLLFEAFGKRNCILPRLWTLSDYGVSSCDPQGVYHLLGQVTDYLIKTSHLPAAQALSLSERFIDLYEESVLTGVDLENALNEFAYEELASHRQDSLIHLERLLNHLQPLLSRCSVFEHISSLERLMEEWRLHPPQALHIAAGFTGKLPLYRKFLKEISQLPNGILLLQGLDPLDDKALENIKEPHPLFHHSLLLKTLECPLHTLTRWPFLKSQTSISQPSLFVHRAFLSVFAPLPALNKPNLSILACQDQAEEVEVTTLILRSVLENPHKTVILVTPDPTLRRSLEENLKRYDIEADLGAGLPLVRSPAGTFMLLLLESLLPKGEMARLSLLKHPFMRCGLPAQSVRSFARIYEKEVLRQPKQEEMPFEVEHFLKTMEQASQTFLAHLNQKEVSPQTLLKAHLALAEQFSLPQEGGAPLLWGGDLGNLVNEAFETLCQKMAALPAIRGQDYEALLKKMMAGSVLRSSRDVHPRLMILDPYQASLQRADVMILAGLNEQIWPKSGKEDPWLSPSLKKKCGLLGDEAHLVEEAYLFCELLLSGQETFLTYSHRCSQGPLAPSSWILRLEALAHSSNMSLTSSIPWQHWAQSIHQGKALQRLPRPEPSPPLDVRPRQLSVSDIQQLVHNPYLYYARRFLKLEEWHPLQGDLGGQMFGILIHKALEMWMKGETKTLETLLEIGLDLMRPYQSVSYEAKYFWPTRFERLAHWVVHEQQGIEDIKESLVECQGTWTYTYDIQKPPLYIRAKADRLDCLLSTNVRVVDYKTGRVPTWKDLEEGRALQLPLEAWMIMEGAFKNLHPSSVYSVEYWSLGLEPTRQIYEGDKLEILLEVAKDALQNLAQTYFEEAQPYGASLAEAFEDKATSFSHLLRSQEWLQPPRP